jgi:hypothetical protein
MLNAAVLLLYLSSSSATTGMTVTAVEYGSTEACEAAGRQAKQAFGGWATTVRWACSPKNTGVNTV